MGLSIVSRLLAQNNGSFSIDTAAGQGTRITIIFHPLHPGGDPDAVVLGDLGIKEQQLVEQGGQVDEYLGRAAPSAPSTRSPTKNGWRKS